MSRRPDKIHLFTAIWGAKYVNEFIETSLRTLLADSNIPAFSKKHTIVYDLFLGEGDDKILKGSKLIAELSNFVTVNFHNLPKNVEDKYLLNFECQKLLIDNPKNSKSAFIWICSDNMYTEGFFIELNKYIEKEMRVVLTFGLALSDQTINQYKSSSFNNSKMAPLPCEILDSVKKNSCFFLEHYDAKKKKFPTWASFAFFGGSKRLSFLRAFHLHPAYFWPERHVKLFPWLDEGVYLSKSCPDVRKWATMGDYSKAIHFSGDKDESLYSPREVHNFFAVARFFAQNCCPSFLQASKQEFFLSSSKGKLPLKEIKDKFKFNIYFNLAIIFSKILRFVPKRILYRKGIAWRKYRKDIDYFRNGATYFDFYMRRLFLDKGQGLLVKELLQDKVYKQSLCKKNAYNFLILSFDHASDSYMRVFDLLLNLIESSSRSIKNYNYAKLKEHNRDDILSYIHRQKDLAVSQNVALS
ncbi:MAG: hypothetical protein S4CHLAM6_02150 [Chlamydiae bacterium]|nr:hypothetical protein [Chlamydiota bacterium]